MVDVQSTQNALLEAIFSPQSDTLDRSQGLRIYRDNLRATAQRALQISFPTIHALVGEDVFAAASLQLLERHPPQFGDWGQWGEGFSDVLHAMPELQDYPFVADTAELDWQRHQLERARDQWADMSTLNLLSDSDPDSLHIVLSHNLYLGSSDYPIADIWIAHQQHGANRTARLQTAMELFRHGERHHYLLYRPRFKAQVKALTEVEMQWFNALQNYSLGESLTQMSPTSFSFETWLPQAIQDNLISEISLVNY